MSAADPEVQLIIISLEALRECFPAHLIYLMSGNVALAWDFNQNAGRILLKLPSGVSVQLNWCNEVAGPELGLA